MEPGKSQDSRLGGHVSLLRNYAVCPSLAAAILFRQHFDHSCNYGEAPPSADTEACKAKHPSSHIAKCSCGSLCGGISGLVSVGSHTCCWFRFRAFSIRVAAAAGRYHYFADVLLEALIGLGVFAGTYWTATR